MCVDGWSSGECWSLWLASPELGSRLVSAMGRTGAGARARLGGGGGGAGVMRHTRYSFPYGINTIRCPLLITSDATYGVVRVE